MNLGDHNYSVFLLSDHFVLVLKYCRKIYRCRPEKIKNICSDLCYTICKGRINLRIYCTRLQHHSYGMDSRGEPCPSLFKAHPNSELFKFINTYKDESSRLLKKEYPSPHQDLRRENFWARSCCLHTTRGTPIEVIKRYCES